MSSSNSPSGSIHKRIEFYVRNPGYEGTENAMGTLAIDFESQSEFEMGLRVISSQLLLDKKVQRPFNLANERGEQLGIVPEYVVSWRVFDVADEWQAVFTLPPGGRPAPSREGD